MSPDPSARRPSLQRRLAYGLAVPLGLFAVGEIVIRALDPEPPVAPLVAPLDHAFGQHTRPEFVSHDRLFWQIRPDLDQPLTRHGDRTDGWGLRNRETPGPKRAGKRRVLCLGDSCTYGLGVRFEEAWPSRLGAADPSLDVVNAGVPGYSSYQGVVLSDLRLSGLEPDVVVVEFGINDVAPWPTPVDDQWVYLTDVERAVHLQYTRRPWNSALVGWLAARVALPAPRRKPADASPMERVSAEPRVPPDQFADNIRRLAERAPRAILIAWPYRSDLERAAGPADPVGHAGALRMREYRDILRTIAAEGDHRFLDVAELYRSSGLAPSELFVDDVHASGRGAKIVADAVAVLLRD